MTPGHRIIDRGKRDRSKRLLVRVRLVDGRDAGAVLLSEGLALVIGVHPRHEALQDQGYRSVIPALPVQGACRPMLDKEGEELVSRGYRR